MHSRLIARELRTRGFDAKVVKVEDTLRYDNGYTKVVTFTGVIVSLNRQISIQEVKDALSLSFEEIEFQITKISVNQVLVKE